MAKIDGGYYMKARKIQNSEISETAPYVREIWDWILKECNHKNLVHKGRLIKKGQCIRSCRDIQEGLKWKIGWRKMTYKMWECENAMKKLRELGMIATKRTTRGMEITVINYAFYQNPDNYKDKDSRTDTLTTAEPLPNDKQELNNIKNKDIVTSEASVTEPKVKEKEPKSNLPGKKVPYSDTLVFELLLHSDKVMERILGIFWMHRKFHFENWEQLWERYNRDCKAAKILEKCKYSREQLQKGMNYCDFKYPDIDWTLETVNKTINEALKSR